jgi:hypothetical protein
VFWVIHGSVLSEILLELVVTTIALLGGDDPSDRVQLTPRATNRLVCLSDFHGLNCIINPPKVKPLLSVPALVGRIQFVPVFHWISGYVSLPGFLFVLLFLILALELVGALTI